MQKAKAPEIEARTLNKVGWRIIPFLALLYFAAFIDRSNVSFAAEGMNRDLGFSAYVYGLGAGIFFIGYVLFEVPSNLILHKVGARLWIARIAITWSIIALAMIFIKSALGFYTVRFLLGMAEAGFFPGIVYYLTQWVPASHRAKLIGLFMTAIPISTALGGPLSSIILTLNGIFGLAGWQWLFLLETIPSFVLGIITLFYLTDTPAQAKWLALDEREWLVETLRAESADRQSRFGTSVSRIFVDKTVLTLCLAYGGVQFGLYGIILWIPQIFAAAGVPGPMVGFVVSIPYGLAAIGMVLWCRHSDKKNERILHIVAASIVGWAGLAASAFLTGAPLLSIAAVTVGAVGTLAILPIFWTLPASRLNGAAAAGGIALINALGHVGSFAGPFLIGWIKDATGSFTSGLLAVSFGVLATGIVVWLLGRASGAERVDLEPARIVA
ncbi:MAG TPA: MFS transporter [Sphingobium sp.]